MDIDTMPAGREMDALIAKRVMKLTVRQMPWESGPLILGESQPEGYRWDGREMFGRDLLPVPHYSTDILAAWPVAVLLMQRHDVLLGGDVDGEFSVFALIDSSLSAIGSADTMPLAICRAALKVVSTKEAS